MNDNTLKRVYLALFVLGVLLPYGALWQWIEQTGAEAPRLFFRQAFADRVGVFFAINVLLSCLAILTAAWSGLPRLPTVLVSAATLLAGPSAGLPLLLYFQTRKN